MKRTAFLQITAFLLAVALCAACTKHNAEGDMPPRKLSSQPQAADKPEAVHASSLIEPAGKTIAERFPAPEGYRRIKQEEGSFGAFLRSLPLKPAGDPVLYFNGQVKAKDVHAAVIAWDIGKKDLQQCADAVIRLRAEYLFSQKRYEEIHFNFTSGFRAEYGIWRQGYRIAVENNEARWVKAAEPTDDYGSFRKYLETVFTYAGTRSLARELAAAAVADMAPGDVFIQGGSPGHCVIVVDMAENTAAGDKIFLLAQSYMPAQDIHILKNPENSALSPWYGLDFGDNLRTPEWSFTADSLKRFNAE